ncbi:MAG TPA: hypothetical protein PLF01_06130 [Alphaproteobacteria bacterium]|nr:hypothetical protein [Alphaproteobacteria bacterium]
MAAATPEDIAPDAFASLPASVQAERSLMAIQKILDDCGNSYRALMRLGSTGIREDFNQSLSAAVHNLTLPQKLMLQRHANPKAAEMKVDIADHASVTNYLGRCFADSCGHLLSFRVFQGGTVTNARARSGFDVANLVSEGLSAVKMNYDLVMAAAPASDDGYQQLSEIFHDATTRIRPHIQKLGQEIGIDETELYTHRRLAEENLAQRGSIAYIKPLDPLLWHN